MCQGKGYSFITVGILILSSLVLSCAGQIDEKLLPRIDPTDFRTDFNPDLNYDYLVNSVAKVRNYNSKKGPLFKSFSTALYQIHKPTIEYASDIYRLSEKDKFRLLDEYSQHHNEIAEQYFDALKNLLNSTEYLPPKDLTFSYPTYNSVEAFGKILSRRICSVLTTTLSLIKFKSPYGPAINFLNRPCEILLAEAINPIIQAMENHALLKDNIRVEINITQHMRELIMQLATVQDKFKARFETDYERKIFFDLFTSRANLEASISGIIKAGFDLQKYFAIKIDDGDQLVTVSLPEPS